MGIVLVSEGGKVSSYLRGHLKQTWAGPSKKEREARGTWPRVGWELTGGKLSQYFWILLVTFCTLSFFGRISYGCQLGELWGRQLSVDWAGDRRIANSHYLQN